jgi:hypothetical protein
MKSPTKIWKIMVGVIVGLALAFVGFLKINSWLALSLLCDPNRVTTYQAFFLKPISKSELVNITQKYQLEVYRFTLGEHVSSTYSQASYASGAFDGFRTEMLNQSLSNHVVQIGQDGRIDFDSNDIVAEYNTESHPGDLIARFDRGESVLLAVQFKETAIKNVMPFFRDYDQKGMLGNGQEPGHETEQPFGVNFPIRWIHPMGNGMPVSRCEYAK